MPVHTYGVQPGHGHTSRSVCSPVSDAPHRTVRQLGWDNRGRNTVVLVFLATLPPPLGIKKALQDCSRKARLFFIHFLILPL